MSDIKLLEQLRSSDFLAVLADKSILPGFSSDIGTTD
jgi:hypothetical protein